MVVKLDQAAAFLLKNDAHPYYQLPLQMIYPIESGASGVDGDYFPSTTPDHQHFL